MALFRPLPEQAQSKFLLQPYIMFSVFQIYLAFYQLAKLLLTVTFVLTFIHPIVSFRNWSRGGRLIVLEQLEDSIFFKMDVVLVIQFKAHVLSLSTSIFHQIMLGHYRLGHPSFQYLKRSFPNLFLNKGPSLFQCEICALAKHQCAFYPPRPYKPAKPFSTIHSDVWGPLRIPTFQGKKNGLLFSSMITLELVGFIFKRKI